jgi:hypothetical protein
MKRCPQCEFIYEDDQSRCDMDGVLLVFDSRTLPNLHTLATVPEVPSRSRRNRMVPAFATIIVTVAVASFYYFSNQRTIAPANNFPPASVPGASAAAPEAPAAMPPAPTPELNQAQPPASEQAEPEKQPTSPPKPAAAAPAKKATTKPATVKSPEPKKDDSKVGSILKKTGKILKKPFKF